MPMHNHAIIRLSNIHLAFPGRGAVLSGLDFLLSPGERIGLVGPNGAGKTSLLHIAMGLIRPDSGEVAVYGRPREKDADFREVRRRIGLLFQDPDDQLFCPTVSEELAFGPLNLGKSHKEAREIVEKTLAALGLEELSDRVTYRLSGGEKRLVSLAAVLAMEPEVLLLDEPAAGLDEETVGRLAEILTSSDLTYLVVSHDRDFLHRATARTLVLNHGRLS